MKKIKMLLLALTMVTMLGMAAGCGSTDDTTDKNGASSSTEDLKNAGEDVEDAADDVGDAVTDTVNDTTNH